MTQGTSVRSFRHAFLTIAVTSLLCVSLRAEDNPKPRGLRQKAQAKVNVAQPPSLLQEWTEQEATSALALQPTPLATGGPPIVGRASMVINASGNVVYTKNFIGTTCDADIGAPTNWAPSTAYLTGDNAFGTTPSVRIVALNSGTSGAAQPIWNSGFGATTTDGTITWVTEGIVWTAGLNYSVGMVVRPLTGGQFGILYQATNSGIAGVTEPVWPTTAGNTVVNGGVTWKAIGFYPGTFRSCDPMQLVFHPSSGPDTTIASEGDAVGAAQLSGWGEFIAANATGKAAFRAAIAGQLTDQDENGTAVLTAGPGAGTLTKIATAGNVVAGRPDCGFSSIVGINDAGQVIFDAYNSRNPIWKSLTAYTAGNRVIPTVYSGLAFTANNTGVSGAVEPAWPTTPGRTVADGSITWTARADNCDENNHGLMRFTPGPGQELLVALGSSVGGSTVVGFGNDVDSAGSCLGCVYDDIDGLINSSGHVAVVLRLADTTQGVFNFTGPGASTQVARTGVTYSLLSPRISINNSDQVAFKGISGVMRIFRFTPPATTVTVVSLGDDVGLRSGGAANGITFTNLGDYFDLNNGGNIVFQAKLSGVQEGYYFWNGTTGLITEILRRADAAPANSLAPEMISINDANIVAYVTGSQGGEFNRATDASEGHESGGLFFWNAGVTKKAIAVGDVVGGNTVTGLYAQHKSFVRRQLSQASCVATAYTVAGDNAEMDCTEGTPTAGCYTKSPLLFVGCAICPLITLSPPTLPNGTQGIAYSQTITASGGASPYTFSVTSGSLPPGLTLNSANGVLSGTPTTLGTFNFTITATDSSGCTGSQAYSVTITAVAAVADLSITKSGPSSAPANGTLVYTIVVTNNGPGIAINVQLSDPTPNGLTFVSAGICPSFPCALGNMNPGQSITINATYTVNSNAPSPVVNTAGVSSSTTDNNTANNAVTITTPVTVPCPTTAPSVISPPDGGTNVPTTGTLTWNGNGAQAYNIYLNVAGSGCTRLISTTTGTSLAYGGLDPSTTYEWRIDALATNCPTKSTACMRFTTACPTQPPFLIAPLSGNLTGETTFSWTAVPGASEYHVFVTFGTTTREIGKTTGTTLTVTPPDGSLSWYVAAYFSNGCPPVQSAPANIVVCAGAEPPVASVVAEATTGQTYTLAWPAVSGAASYQVDEASTDTFGGANTQTVMSTSVNFVRTVNIPTGFFYRVRAFFSCTQRFGPYSPTDRVVVIPVPPLGVFNPNVAIPVGSKLPVSQQVFLPGFPGLTLPFTATVDKPWLQVAPQSGNLPPEGAVLIVTSDPTNLQNGTISGTVLASVGTAAKPTPTGVTPVSIPVSINLVTPVTPVTRKSPPSNARIIPTVGNVEGLNSRWQSDVRIANTSNQAQFYDLIFIPGGDQATVFVPQTTVQVDSGGTLALDDIVRNWYGIGSLNDRANGILEIIPRDAAAKTARPAVSVSLTTFVSSKTYNLSASGTLPQFVPAVPFAGLIGRPLDPSKSVILGLQQLAQSDQVHTNLGLAEAGAQPASVLVSAFDSAGKKLLDLPVELNANQQKQINSFLAQNNIFVPDARIEVRVTAGDGLVTAYASVVDSKSGDPLLVSGTPLGQTLSNHYVIPGVADLNTGFASWRTDARVFNSGTTAQALTLTFYPEANSSAPKTASVSVNPGEVKRLDNMLQAIFGVTNVGGAVHITTQSAAPLVVTARTFNQTSSGTLGQFIPAATSNDAVTVNDRALQILQLEESARYRTNLGLAEVSGKPVRVEVSLVLPDSKVSPKTEIPLGANEFRQFNIIRNFGIPNVYNARIAVRVISGDGSITAYGSIIDQKTQAPSYVPAQ